MHKHRKKHIKENNLLLDEVKYTGDVNNPTEIYVIHYTESSFSQTQLAENAIPDLSNPKEMIWIQVKGLLNTHWIQEITNKVGIPQLVLQDVLQPQSISRIEEYENMVMASLKYNIFEDAGHFSDSEHISIALAKGVIITFQESDRDIFGEIITAVKLNTVHLRSRSSDFLFLSLINHILTKYAEILNQLENTIEIMEEELLDNYNVEDDFRLRLKTHHLVYQIMKQSVFPLKDGFNKIQVSGNELFAKKNKIYVNTVIEQYKYLLQSIEICRESFDSLVNLYISNNDLRMNEIMKRLTVISAIFIPLTFLAGVWGMNYEFMPELKFRYGYLLAWSIMLFIGLTAWWFIRKRKWY